LSVDKAYYLYFLASSRNGTLYVGVTSDLVRRVHEHKTGAVDGFTKDYDVHHLVYFEVFDDPTTAIQREKTVKGWPRQWKINKIEEKNPTWRDLFEEIAS
jgi:putative endonuclease